MARGRVLLVDDEDVLCETMRLCLESEGFIVRAAASADDALVKLSAEEFHVVVLDILMPGANGAELIRRIRERRIASEIVVATGAGTHELGQEALRLGACDVLRKPILNLGEKLVRSVAAAAERYTLRHALQRAEARANEVERRLNELYQLSRAILDAADDEALVRTLDAAVRALHRPAPHVLLRASGQELVEVGVRDGLRVPFSENTGELPSAVLPLPPAASMFPLASGRRVVGAFAIGELAERDSQAIVPLLALLPALTCRLLAACARDLPAPAPAGTGGR
jgi:FixJ family two-component response regulator